MTDPEKQADNFVEFFNKFKNFYKFIKDCKHVLNEIIEAPPLDVGPIIAAAEFIPKIREIRKDHPEIVQNVRDWAKCYYERQDSGSSSSGLRSSLDDVHKEALEQNIVSLALVLRPKVDTNKLKASLKDNIDTAITLIRYMDLFFDHGMIPDL